MEYDDNARIHYNSSLLPMSSIILAYEYETKWCISKRNIIIWFISDYFSLHNKRVEYENTNPSNSNDVLSMHG